MLSTGMKIPEPIPMFFKNWSQIRSSRKVIRTQLCAKTTRLRFFSIPNAIYLSWNGAVDYRRTLPT